MKVRFWGVRGSTPTPQIENMGVGGNTSCVEIRTPGKELLIFDGGTGIRMLGKELEREFEGNPIRGHIFFSHFHLDHIQGIPFFSPLYNARNHFTFCFGGRHDASVAMDALSRMMANPYFPIDMSKLPCSREFMNLSEGTFKTADASILVLPLDHPQGCAGYRVESRGKTVAYCTDVAHGQEWSNRNLQTLAWNSDLLIVDSQFTPDELPHHAGWGHSSWEESVRAGAASGAKQIALYHHDPYRSDAEIENILASAGKIHPKVIAAREGLEVHI